MEKSKEDIAKLLAKALKTQEPVVYNGRSCFLKTLSYQDDLILSSIIQDVCVEALDAGVGEAILKRAASTAAILGTVKMALYDAETGKPVFPTMQDLNETVRASAAAYTEVQRLFDVYAEALELTKAEKKS